MRTALFLNIVFLSFFSTHLAMASKEFLADGVLKINESSSPIDVGNYQSIFVGVTGGRVDCDHFTMQPRMHVALLESHFQVGSAWYEQSTCYASGTRKCSIGAEAGSSIQYEPRGSFIKVLAVPMKRDTGYVQCTGSISYEVWGE